jgi:hypothetical protein
MNRENELVAQVNNLQRCMSDQRAEHRKQIAELESNTNPLLKKLLRCCDGLSSDYANKNYGDAEKWLRHIDTAYQEYQDQAGDL